MFKKIVLLLAIIATLSQAFIPKAALPTKTAVSLATRAKTQQQTTTPFSRTSLVTFLTAEEEEAQRKLTFDNNMRSRKGRTTDEDGKSNIWAYESKEEVEVKKGSGFVVLGLVLAVFIGALSFLPQIQFPNYD
jgi:hypothetical protein